MGRNTQTLLRERFELGSTEALAFTYVLIVAGLLLLWGQSSPIGLLVWAGLLAVLAPAPKIVQSIDVSFSRWFALEFGAEAITGVAWGLVTVIALPADPVRQALLCAMLIGVMVAASASASQFLTLHLAFIIPFTALVIAGYLRSPDGLLAAAAMLFIAFVFSVIMAGEHRAVHHNLVDLIVQNEGLVGDLAAERDALSAANRQLDDQAWSDSLTGLANRAAFTRALADALDHLEPAGSDTAHHRRVPVTIAALDLDGFKQINDTWGHHIGDLVLIAVADALSAAATPDELVSRLGGDELVVLSRTADLDQLGARLARAISTPLVIEGRTLELRAGIGIVSATAPASPDALMRYADHALYRHKRSDDSCTHQLFDDAMGAELEQQHLVTEEVRRAFEAGEILPWLQPIVDMATGEIVGAESLARWEHPDGVRSAASFIGVMADQHLLDDLTARTLLKIEEFTVGLAGRGLRPPRISVNVPPHQLEWVLQTHTGTRTLESICIEVTEESAVPNPERAAELLERARAAGAQVHIDDFGIGYSSLALASSLPIDGLKIDRSFVATLTTSDASLAVVSAIVDLADRLGLGVIAEGVESPAQAELLLSLGVRRAQGFLYAPAVPPAQLGAWIETEHRFSVGTTTA